MLSSVKTFRARGSWSSRIGRLQARQADGQRAAQIAKIQAERSLHNIRILCLILSLALLTTIFLRCTVLLGRKITADSTTRTEKITTPSYFPPKSIFFGGREQIFSVSQTLAKHLGGACCLLAACCSVSFFFDLLIVVLLFFLFCSLLFVFLCFFLFFVCFFGCLFRWKVQEAFFRIFVCVFFCWSLVY